METFYIAWFLRKINRTLLPPLPILSWCPQSSINNMIIFGKGCYWQFCYEPKLISYKKNMSTTSKNKKIKKYLWYFWVALLSIYILNKKKIDTVSFLNKTESNTSMKLHPHK